MHHARFRFDQILRTDPLQGNGPGFELPEVL